MDMKSTPFRFFLLFLWISFSLFLRNEILLKSYWLGHYESIGLVFPEAPLNQAVWVLWSLCFCGYLTVLATRFEYWGTVVLGWMGGFVLVEIVVGNMGILPMEMLWSAVPLSFGEMLLAGLILFAGRPNRSKPAKGQAAKENEVNPCP